MAMVYAVCQCANQIEAFRYRFVDGRLLMPVSIQAHHSFVDGLHIGQFAEKLQKFFDED